MSTTTEKFDRVILAFDEQGFAHQQDLTERYCTEANAAVDAIKEDYDLPLSDAEISAIFLQLDANPSRMIESHFAGQKSRTLREEAIADLKGFINQLLFSLRQFDANARKAVMVKKGRLTVDAKEIEAVKKQFETALETPRAVELYNMHQELFQKYVAFQEAASNSPAARNLWFEDLNQGKWRIKELNYNNL